MLPALLTTVFFALSGISATRIAKLLGGVAANFWRVVWATLLLALWSHLFGAGLTGKAFPLFFLSGVVGFGIGDVALYQALPRIGSRLSILLVHCLAAPFGALVEWLWLGTVLSVSQMLCAAIILAGVALALGPGGHLHLPRRTWMVGTAFGVLAGLAQGLGAVLSRQASAVGKAAAEEISGVNAAYQRIVGGLLVSLIVFLAVKHREKLARGATPAPPTPWRAALPWLLFNGVLGPVLGVSCYQWALSTTPTGVVLPIVAMTPLVIIPFARYFEGEKPTGRSLLGGFIGVLGVAALAWVTHRAK